MEETNLCGRCNKPKGDTPESCKCGRPPKFKTVEELECLISDYFKKKDEEKKPYTITGLANALDTTRETLLDYENRDGEFSYTIKKAKSKVEEYVEDYLFTGKNQTGAIFNLKNNYKGWKDKNETDLTTGGKEFNFKWEK
jgi:hypothetical protein